MNRSEFLDKLREALENDLSGPVVRENIEYYDSYIQSEVRNGKTEQEVLDMLGDPWMIARTIIDTDENEREYYGSASVRTVPCRIPTRKKRRSRTTVILFCI